MQSAGFKRRLGEYQRDYHPPPLFSKDGVCILMTRRTDSNGISGYRKTTKSKYQKLRNFGDSTRHPPEQNKISIYSIPSLVGLYEPPPPLAIFYEKFGFWELVTRYFEKNTFDSVKNYKKVQMSL